MRSSNSLEILVNFIALIATICVVILERHLKKPDPRIYRYDTEPTEFIYFYKRVHL